MHSTSARTSRTRDVRAETRNGPFPTSRTGVEHRTERERRHSRSIYDIQAGDQLGLLTALVLRAGWWNDRRSKQSLRAKSLTFVPITFWGLSARYSSAVEFVTGPTSSCSSDFRLRHLGLCG